MPTLAIGNTLIFDLAEPGLSLMHRAGLAGLYMTLGQLPTQNPVGMQWELSPTRISLSWPGQDKEAIDWLLGESFQLNPDGLICLRGIRAKQMPISYLAIAHQGILGTLLQHTSTHKSRSMVVKPYYADEDKPPVFIQFKALDQYAYQSFSSSLCDSKGQLHTKPIKVAGWLNPGAAVRHQAFTSHTSFEEPAHLALVLLFASVACCYFRLRSHLQEARAQYALVIPEVTNLEKYAKLRLKVNKGAFHEFWASSLGDAGLQFLAMAEKLTGKLSLEACQVVTMGTVPWSTQQKTRTDTYWINISQNSQQLGTYKASREHLSDRILLSNNKQETYIETSLAREIIADNLARGQPWFAGFATKIHDSELFHKLTYEREGLNNMIKAPNIEWSDTERHFVEACHEAIRNSYGILRNRTKEGDVLRFDKFNERLRTRLARCKSPATFREFMADFWSRAGYLSTFQNHRDEIMELILSDWKKARDLTLLSMASYKGAGNKDDRPNTEDIPEDSQTNTEDNILDVDMDDI